MPFHVEISGGLNHARAFNLDAAELRRSILGPWRAGRAVELGEQVWEPGESSLRVLEGPHLDPPDLSFGQGWSNAERSAEDVTRRELAATAAPSPPDAFAVEAEHPEAALAEMLAGRGATPIALDAARAQLDGREPQLAAVVLVLRKPEPGSGRS